MPAGIGGEPLTWRRSAVCTDRIRSSLRAPAIGRPAIGGSSPNPTCMCHGGSRRLLRNVGQRLLGHESGAELIGHAHLLGAALVKDELLRKALARIARADVDDSGAELERR